MSEGVNERILRAYLCVHGEGGDHAETDHIGLSRTVHASTREKQRSIKAQVTWSGEEL